MKEVKKLRLEKGWNQNELAFHAELAPSVISLVETGRRAPNATTLRKLAEALGVEIPDLFERSDSPKVQSPQLEREAAARDYVTVRVEWCERVMEKTEGDFIYPFASLDTAIQWAMCVGVESAAMKNAISRIGADASQDLRDLVDRMAAVSERTDARVKVMMQQSALNEEEKQQVHLRLIQGQRSA